MQEITLDEKMDKGKSDGIDLMPTSVPKTNIKRTRERDRKNRQEPSWEYHQKRKSGAELHDFF